MLNGGKGIVGPLIDPYFVSGDLGTLGEGRDQVRSEISRQYSN